MSMTNTLVNNVCYPTVSQAADAFFSAIPVTMFTNATNTYRVMYSKDAVGWNHIKQSWDASGVFTPVYSFPVSTPNFPACDVSLPYTEFVDAALLIIGALLGVWATWWGVYQLYKMMHWSRGDQS